MNQSKQIDAELQMTDTDSALEAVLRERDQLRLRVTELEAGLKPFAEIWLTRFLDPWGKENGYVTTLVDGEPCRRAAQLLAGQPKRGTLHAKCYGTPSGAGCACAWLARAS